mmetsp:Transcript_14382/g.27348  ORF Transcript_14382/g.27348 Transcript_14382/m.27348 type:complete len:104 (+) Transcript_14382:315-626(+)
MLFYSRVVAPVLPMQSGTHSRLGSTSRAGKSSVVDDSRRFCDGHWSLDRCRPFCSHAVLTLSTVACQEKSFEATVTVQPELPIQERLISVVRDLVVLVLFRVT